MTNFRLLIEYDGTDLHGWQIQKEQRTVQGDIQNALEIMTGRKLVVNGSGRTDAGVHALGQVANFHCETRLTPAAFQSGLNGLLKDDIVIRECAVADDDFHARYDASAKTYRYHILNRTVPSAVGRRFHWSIQKPLDLERMRAAASLLVGEHDFKAFEGSGSPRSTTVRTVSRAEWRAGPDGALTFEIRADGFLRYMVRNIVGTLVAVGSGKMTSSEVAAVLRSRDRERAGATAPPQGLFLVNVEYGLQHKEIAT